MKYKVDTKILNDTTSCNDNHSCLFGKKDCLCEVEKYLSIKGKVVFITPNKYRNCNYLMDFGNNYICNCPTREELYSQYDT